MGVGVDQAGQDQLIAGLDGVGGLIIRGNDIGAVDRHDCAAVDGDRARRNDAAARILGDHGPAGHDQRDTAPVALHAGVENGGGGKDCGNQSALHVRRSYRHRRLPTISLRIFIARVAANRSLVPTINPGASCIVSACRCASSLIRWFMTRW